MGDKSIKRKFSDEPTQGSGYLTWRRLEKRFRESGEITEQQKLKKVEVDKDGISYLTRKKRKDEDE